MEGHMCHARFVEDADRMLVNHRQAGIAPTFALVEHHLVFLRPGDATIQARLDGDMVAVLRRVRVREEEDVALQGVLVGVYVNEARHADRLGQGGTVRGMFFPGAPQVARDGDRPAPSPVIAHIEHQYARFYFGHLRLGGIRAGRLMEVPRLAGVLTIHDARVGDARRVDELDGEHERPVVHRDAPPGSLEEEVPRGVFHLLRDVDRFAPRLAIVFAFGEEELGGLVRIHALPGIEPRPLVSHPMAPSRGNPEGMVLPVYEDGRVSHAILRMGQASFVPHGHGDAHRFPSLSFVGTPADANNPIQDGSCVLENMMLAAHAIGLASCWIHREREMFSTDEGKELMASFGLPEGLVGIGAISLGYPAKASDAPKPRKIDYYRVIK